ncbi:hypothetical protein [Dysgonomonas alginatilytica]|uniref:hypothetical protein n=1 Tax=Dysgonomonas alginatilytica TaxID=1605892 RepID=UPI0011B4A23F|nr:hypothetical protein [Dysgonomonas alginatilytica]
MDCNPYNTLTACDASDYSNILATIQVDSPFRQTPLEWVSNFNTSKNTNRHRDNRLNPIFSVHLPLFSVNR